MTIDIDVTEMKAHELKNLLDSYPNGHLVIKFDRVFWSSEQSGPMLPRCNPGGSPQQGVDPNNPGRNLASGFQKAADTLGNMMGPPRRN